MNSSYFNLFFFTNLLLFLASSNFIYGKSESALNNTLLQHYKFRVYLKDKGRNDYSIDNPTQFLSEKAIERKILQNSRIDETDFPICTDYINLVKKAGGNIISHSKWFNTLVVEVNDSLKINDINSLSFVDSVKYVWRGAAGNYKKTLRPRLKQNITCRAEIIDSIYGFSSEQFKFHNADKLYECGFRGKGINIGVIDAGFTNYDVIPAFENVNLLGYENLVPEGDLFSTSDHGTKVLSTMAVNLPGMMIGSAPEASYYLLRSEDVTSEFPVEEDYWVRAIEYADSVGLDLINTSLGYNEFDDKYLNYSHEDLNGETSFMSRAADMAYEKGMLIVVSAGNEGNKTWKKSTPPGDAKNVVTVGAVGTDSLIATFSSHGILADGRIKPDMVSVGKATVTIGRDGTIGNTNGTSLSSPFLAGLIASLWSVNPTLHRSELIEIVMRSSDRYDSPDAVYGYGIPDFQKALTEVLKTIEIEQSVE